MNSHTTWTGKPTIILSPEWRFMAELFSAEALQDLHARFDIVWGQDGTIPDDLYSKGTHMLVPSLRLSRAFLWTISPVRRI